jgi:hypothetical protein
MRVNAVKEAAQFLLAHADRLEMMAQESRTGGWSTHQVDEQREQATLCRSQAAKLLNAVLVDLS